MSRSARISRSDGVAMFYNLATMAPNRYRELAVRMKDRGHSSPYLDRIEAHLSLEERQESLELEIRRETAASLGRAGVKVDFAMLALEDATLALDEAPAEERDARWAAYTEAHAAASRALLDLKITREAVGLRNHSTLHRMYPIPPRRSA